MAYSLPELVLVGAAQSLVLETSSDVLKHAVIDCYGSQDRDSDEVTYNFESTW